MLCLLLITASLQFFEAISDIQGQVDENSVGLAFDFIVSEEDVCPEVVDRFVNYILLLKLGEKNR